MEDLIKTVSEKAGINMDQAKSAIASVMEFLKGKLPLGIGEQVQGLLGGEGGSDPLAGATDAIRAKLGV